MGRRRQSVLEFEDAQVGVVLHIALGLCYQQQHGFAAAIGLVIGRHPHLIVVANGQLELDFGNFFFGTRGPVDEGRRVEVVEQADLFRAIGRDEAFLDEPSLDGWFKADFPAVVNSAVVVGNDDVRTHREEGGSTAAVCGRVVAEDQFDKGNGLVLVNRQGPGNGVALKAVAQGIGLVGVDEVNTDLGEVADLRGGPAAH